MEVTHRSNIDAALIATSQTPRNRLAASQWWYAPLVIGLATFLMAIAYRHPPIHGYLGQAAVQRDESEARSLAPTRVDVSTVEKWLASDISLSHIAKQAGLAGDLPLAANPFSAGQLQQVRGRLQVARTTDGEVQNWNVHYLGHDRREASRMADAAAETLADYLDRLHDTRPTEPELAAMRQRIHAAHDEEDRLRHEIDALRHDQLTHALLHARQQTIAGENRFPVAAVPGDETPTPAQPPERSQLEFDIEQLRIERGKLAANRLPTHPQVVAIDAQIAQLQEQLNRNASRGIGPLIGETEFRGAAHSESEWLSSTKAKFASRTVDGGEDGLDLGVNIAARIEDAGISLRAIVRERKEAEIRLDTALRVAAQPWQKQWHSIRGPAAQRIGGTPRGADILWAGWIGCAAAVAMSFNLNWFRRLQAIGSAAQARNSLGVPLLGEIELPHGMPMVSRLPARFAPKRVLLRTAEWLLIATLVTLLLAALSSRALGAQLLHDPLGALVEAMDGIRSAIQ